MEAETKRTEKGEKNSMGRRASKTPLEQAMDQISNHANEALAQIERANDIIGEQHWIDRDMDHRGRRNAKLCASVFRRNAVEAESALRDAITNLDAEIKAMGVILKRLIAIERKERRETTDRQLEKYHKSKEAAQEKDAKETAA